MLQLSTPVVEYAMHLSPPDASRLGVVFTTAAVKASLSLIAAACCCCCFACTVVLQVFPTPAHGGCSSNELQPWTQCDSGHGNAGRDSVRKRRCPLRCESVALCCPLVISRTLHTLRPVRCCLGRCSAGPLQVSARALVWFCSLVAVGHWACLDRLCHSQCTDCEVSCAHVAARARVWFCSLVAVGHCACLDHFCHSQCTDWEACCAHVAAVVCVLAATGLPWSPSLCCAGGRTAGVHNERQSKH